MREKRTVYLAYGSNLNILQMTRRCPGAKPWGATVLEDYALIHNNPCKVAWIGDYSNLPYEPKNDAYARALPYEHFSVFFDLAWGENENFPLQPENFSDEQLSLVNCKASGMYIINHSRKCYLELGAYIQRATPKSGFYKDMCIDPLPLLTACGNGRGNGDFYRGNLGYEYVGLWAFDELEYSDKLPQCYTEGYFCFIESD